MLCACVVLLLSAAGMAQEAAPAVDTEPWLIVPVQAIQCADITGSRRADITPAEVSEWVEFANQTYAPAKIVFTFDREHDFARLDDTLLNELEALPGGQDPAAKARARKVMGEIDKLASQYPGKMLVLFRNGVGIAPTGNGFSGGLLNCVVMPGFRHTSVHGHQNISLFSLIVGHYLGLRRTFRDFETTSAAAEYLLDHQNDPSALDWDGLHDTPPDPFIREIAATDPSPDSIVLNGIEFRPPCDNIMSFWDTPTKTVSPMQAAIARWSVQMKQAHGMMWPTNAGVSDPIEAEDMKITNTRGCRAGKQVMTPWAEWHWSGEAQLFCAFSPDGSLELTLPVASSGKFRINLYGTRWARFGKFQLHLDGKALGEPFDAYAPVLVPTGPVSLGVVELTAGEHSLRFDVVGKSEAAAGHNLGIDCFELVPDD